jgi:hypothetical protein
LKFKRKNVLRNSSFSYKFGHLWGVIYFHVDFKTRVETSVSQLLLSSEEMFSRNIIYEEHMTRCKESAEPYSEKLIIHIKGIQIHNILFIGVLFL